MSKSTYTPSEFGKKEVELIRKFQIQRDDARDYFLQCIRPRLDRSYKLYMAYTGDRAKEIKQWQSNVFTPYIQSVVETLMPRILDARPEFSVQGRNEDDQLKAKKLQSLMDYTWETNKMDAVSEDLVRSAMVYGTGYMYCYWRRDVRTHKFLETRDLGKKKYVWKEREQVFYDAPAAEWVDNYELLYDWHNIARKSKQYWFRRKVLTGAEIKRRYPHHDKKRLTLALDAGGGDTQDYAQIRNEIKQDHDNTVKGADRRYGSRGSGGDRYDDSNDPDLSMHEVYEWWRPFDDAYAVMVNDVPILKGAVMPMIYDVKEVPIIEVPYLKLPNEFEGIGLPIILESPQVMMNMIKNQRLDAATLNIHKMWIVNPLANVDKNELVTRPFGIIYSTDPAGVREVQFSDIKASAYKEEELLKADMRYASGVDDFSMGVGGGASSATEVRHLRESTLERVRLFINHLGDGFSDVMRWWIDMHRQFYTKKLTMRIVGDSGMPEYPLVEKDDLKGEFDFAAAVIPSIAGKNDIDRKQGMDLYQLLINLPFIDPRKLTSKILHHWNWSIETLVKEEQPQPMVPGMPGAEGAPGAPGMVMPPGAPGMAMPPEMANMPGAMPGGGIPTLKGGGAISPDAIRRAIGAVGPPGAGPSPFAEAGAPINLLEAGGLPPTAPKIGAGGAGGRGGQGGNPRGHNMGGKVNTNLPTRRGATEEGNLLAHAANIQA